MHLLVIGLNHKTAPIEVRERFSLSKDAVRRKFIDNDLGEAVLLSTCNRTEIYARCADVDTLRNMFFADVRDEYLYTFYGVNCIRHLFEVASSLDSLVLGEGQILSQVKEAYALSENIRHRPSLKCTFALQPKSLATQCRFHTRRSSSRQKNSAGSAIEMR